LSLKSLYKNRAGGVAQSEGCEFKPQFHKKKKKERETETQEFVDRMHGFRIYLYVTLI
jgi:hypothetical protein